jgi:hypothetical protein
MGLLVVLLLALLGAGAAAAWGQDAGEVPVCCGPSALEETMATLAVTVGVMGAGGAPPARGMEAPAPQRLGVGAGLPVQALAHDGSGTVIAQAVTDTDGKASLDVAPGQYWVVVPAAGGLPGMPGAGALVSQLPDGTRVFVSQEVSAGAGETVPVSLAIMIMLP